MLWYYPVISEKNYFSQKFKQNLEKAFNYYHLFIYLFYFFLFIFFSFTNEFSILFLTCFSLFTGDFAYNMDTVSFNFFFFFFFFFFSFK